MINIKEKADAFLTKHYRESFSMRVALKHAIISTENTIEVLKEAFEVLDNEYDKSTLCGFIAKQTEILNELKSRL